MLYGTLPHHSGYICIEFTVGSTYFVEGSDRLPDTNQNNRPDCTHPLPPLIRLAPYRRLADERGEQGCCNCPSSGLAGGRRIGAICWWWEGQAVVRSGVVTALRTAPGMNDVTRILSAIDQGDPHATEQLLPLV